MNENDFLADSAIENMGTMHVCLPAFVVSLIAGDHGKADYCGVSIPSGLFTSFSEVIADNNMMLGKENVEA